MLMGPWALTTAGAATVETAPAAATFRKRRRVEVVSLLGLVMASSLDERLLLNRPLFVDLLAASLGLCQGLASLVVVMRRYDAPPGAGSDPMVPLFWISRQSGSQGPNGLFAMPVASAQQYWRGGQITCCCPRPWRPAAPLGEGM